MSKDFDNWFFKEAAPVITSGFERTADVISTMKGELGRTQKKIVELFEKREMAARFEDLGQGSQRRVAVAQHDSLRTRCEMFLAQNPEARTMVGALIKHGCRAGAHLFTKEEAAIAQKYFRSLGTGDGGLGAATSLPEPLSEFVFSQLFLVSAFPSLSVIPMDTARKRFVKARSRANAYCYPPNQQGQAKIETPTIDGSSLTPEVVTIAAVLAVSAECFDDGLATIEAAFLEILISSLAYRIDHCCFSADGDADEVDGGMTGIFAHADVPVSTALGHNAIIALTGDDFADCMGKVHTSAFAHPCRWWLSPAFLPKLLKTRETSDPGSPRLLKPPTGPDDEWRIHGYPITFVEAAPSADDPGAKVAAFGRSDAYLVGLRQDFEVMSSPHPAFNRNSHIFRAIARARGEMRDAASLATLKLAV